MLFLPFAAEHTELEDQLHHEALDFVGGIAIGLFLEAHGVFHFPVADRSAQFGRKSAATEVDDQIEGIALMVADGLGENVAEVDVALRHDLASHRHDVGGRVQSGAFGDEDIAAIAAGEAFGHLAADGVADAYEQDAERTFHAAGLSLGHLSKEAAVNGSIGGKFGMEGGDEVAAAGKDLRYNGHKLAAKKVLDGLLVLDSEFKAYVQGLIDARCDKIAAGKFDE